jgi:hypothetical protein
MRKTNKRRSRSERRSQQERESKREKILLGTLALAVKGDKGRADKTGKHLLQALGQPAAMSLRENVLLPRRIIVYIAATSIVRLRQGSLDFDREIFLLLFFFAGARKDGQVRRRLLLPRTR